MRRPRLDLPGIPQHLTHRGVNRAATFLDEDDYRAYLQALDACARQHAVQLHAYALMTNHVHLLVSAEAKGSVSRMMQAVGRRYVRAFNARYQRTGTLWEGRYKSCLVGGDRYLMTCLRYIELNPIRAAIVESPEEYPWSSARAHLGLRTDPRLTPHPRYIALGSNPVARAAAYRLVLNEGISQDDLAMLRDYLRQERAMGSTRFQSMVEKTLNRPVTLRSPGRPKQRSANSNANVL
jgi:putative transposase